MFPINLNVVNNAIQANDAALERQTLKRYRSTLREEYEVLNLTEEEFRRTFRVTKAIFDYLYTLLGPHLKQGHRRGSLSARLKVRLLIIIAQNDSDHLQMLLFNRFTKNREILWFGFSSDSSLER